VHRELEESRADAAARADEALRTGAALEESRRALEAAERAHAAAGDAWAEERAGLQEGLARAREAGKVRVPPRGGLVRLVRKEGRDVST